jgi:hypothetical protein
MARRVKMQPVAARYFDLLAEEGFRPTCDRIDDTVSAVLFKVEGTKVVIFTDEEDEDFFHMGLAIELNEGMEIPWALDRANHLSDDLKAVKVTVRAEDRSVRFRIEAFLPGPPTLEMIRRSVGAVDNAAKQFFATDEAPKRLDA